MPAATPRIVRLMLLHALIGFGIAALFVAALLHFGPGDLGRLLWRVGGVEAVLLLWLFSGLTFGSVQMGIAVMSLGEARRKGGSGGLRLRIRSFLLLPSVSGQPGPVAAAVLARGRRAGR